MKKITYSILRFPIIDRNNQYILSTDASSIAVGGGLGQIQADVKEYPISFYFKEIR